MRQPSHNNPPLLGKMTRSVIIMQRSSPLTIIIAHFQVPEFDAAQVRTSSVFQCLTLCTFRTDISNKIYLWWKVEVITAAEDVRGGPLQSEGAPLQPKNAFGDVVLWSLWINVTMVMFQLLYRPVLQLSRSAVGVIYILTKSPPQVQEYLTNQHKPPLQSTKPRNQYQFPRYCILLDLLISRLSHWIWHVTDPRGCQQQWQGSWVRWHQRYWKRMREGFSGRQTGDFNHVPQM